MSNNKLISINNKNQVEAKVARAQLSIFHQVVEIFLNRSNKSKGSKDSLYRRRQRLNWQRKLSRTCKLLKLAISLREEARQVQEGQLVPLLREVSHCLIIADLVKDFHQEAKPTTKCSLSKI